MSLDNSSLPAWANYLANAGHQAPSADNSQPWRFRWDPALTTLRVSRSDEGLGADHPAVLMAMGAVSENMVQAALAIGMDPTSWQFIVQSEERLDTLRIPQPPSGFSLIQNLPLSITQRHTNRNAFFKTPIPQDIVRKIAALSEGNVKTLVVEDRDVINQIVNVVSLASEARFQTEEIHRWFAQSLRFTEQEVAGGDGLDVATLCLPPGGKLLLNVTKNWSTMNFLNRVGGHKLFAKVEGSGLRNCGAIVAFTGSVATKETWLSAGRLLQRVWLLLASQDLAAQPYFVLSDQLHRLKTNQIPADLRNNVEEIEKQVKTLPGIEQQTLFTLLRVGRAKAKAVRSRRVLLDAVTSLIPK
ncbi:MAG: hypothetical protein V4568_05660 [Pseudomonadota bacterium]